MLDNLRESASQSPFFQENQTPPPNKPDPVRRQRQPSGPFLGLTAVQRFILALMLFIMTCLLGTLCLMVTEKIVLRLPF
jgi:hypothetical protein